MCDYINRAAGLVFFFLDALHLKSRDEDPCVQRYQPLLCKSLPLSHLLDAQLDRHPLTHHQLRSFALCFVRPTSATESLVTRRPIHSTGLPARRHLAGAGLGSSWNSSCPLPCHLAIARPVTRHPSQPTARARVDRRLTRSGIVAELVSTVAELLEYRQADR